MESLAEAYENKPIKLLIMNGQSLDIPCSAYNQTHFIHQDMPPPYLHTYTKNHVGTKVTLQWFVFFSIEKKVAAHR